MGSGHHEGQYGSFYPIAIAHRLSTIRHATRIYALAGSRIVQRGRFDELAQQEGLCAQLMARQMLTA